MAVLSSPDAAGGASAHPERLQPIGADLVRRLQDLVGAIEVDLDEAIPHDA